MYEMKGALSGRAAPDRPVARPSRRRTPPRQCQAPARNTGFPAFPAPPGSPPDGARFQRWMSFYCLWQSCARACRDSFSVCLMSTRCPQDNAGYPHVMAVIHRLMHNLSTGDLA